MQSGCELHQWVEFVVISRFEGVGVVVLVVPGGDDGHAAVLQQRQRALTVSRICGAPARVFFCGRRDSSALSRPNGRPEIGGTTFRQLVQRHGQMSPNR